jgi:hypothetical protein
MRAAIALIPVLLLSVAPAGAEPLSWTSICPDTSVDYCEHVGKTAHNAQGPAILRNVELGKIVGVAWRPKGSVIGKTEPLPSAGIPGSIRTAPENSHYYIIGDGGGTFLRRCREIAPR